MNAHSHILPGTTFLSVEMFGDAVLTPLPGVKSASQVGSLNSLASVFLYIISIKIALSGGILLIYG